MSDSINEWQNGEWNDVEERPISLCGDFGKSCGDHQILDIVIDLSFLDGVLRTTHVHTVGSRCYHC